MKKFTWIVYFINWLIRFIYLQLFLTLISFPILIAWGLPISLLTPIGNLIFSPLLTAFLLIASLTFFCELLYLPNGYLIYCLEKITALWYLMLSWNHRSWLIGFTCPHFLLLLLIPIGTILITFKKKHNRKLAICYLSCILIATGTYLKITSYRSAPHIDTIDCNNGEVTIITNAQNTVIIDPGYIGQRASFQSWINYTLIPHLLKTTGKLIIDYLIIMQPSSRTFQAVTLLSEKVTIHHCYLTYWHGSLPRSAWYHFFCMRNTLKKNNCVLKRIYNKTCTITPSNQLQLHIKPHEKQLQYHEATYPPLEIIGFIDKKPVAIYAAKLKNQLK